MTTLNQLQQNRSIDIDGFASFASIIFFLEIKICTLHLLHDHKTISAGKNG